MNIILISVIVLGVIGLLSGLILYFTAQKFKVYEDPKIDEVEEVLPSANCGGCGYPGCRNFAEACVAAETLDNLFCPVGGNDVMKKVAEILGKTVEEQDPLIAVVRCSGSPEFRKVTTNYEGVMTCAIEHALYGGHTDCQYGCLGHGDCVVVCEFDAIHMNPKTLLPEVEEDKCTGCGACVEACPKDIIELRPQGPKNRRIYVSCVNQDKGGVAKKACEVACIGCKACVKACKFDAITIDNFLAYIDADACRLCRACVPVCPTNSILEINFPPRKTKKTETKKQSDGKDTIDLKSIANEKNKENKK
jgi:Na+-translocating ferredoxin:NAD+ oxidoreductase RNF subunit RnfB